MNYCKKIFSFIAITILTLIPVLVHAQDIGNSTNVNFNTSGGFVRSGYLNNTNLGFTVSGSIESYSDYDHADILINGILLGSVSVDKSDFIFTRDVSTEAKRQELIDSGILTNGQNDITLEIFDNTDQLVVDPPTDETFIVDFDNPTLDIDVDLSSSVSTGYLKVGDRITFTLGSDEELDLNSIASKFNNKDLKWTDASTPSSYKYQGEYVVEEGDETIDSPVGLLVEAQDLAGNETTRTFENILDGTQIDADFPSLIINSPSQGQYISKSRVEVSYLVSNDVSQEKVEVDGKEVDLGNGYLELEDGVHTLKITAIDEAGNITTESVEFIVDTTSPSFSYEGKSNIKLNSGDSLLIRGTTEPNTEVQIEVHSQVEIYKTISDNDGNWTITLNTEGLAPGGHSIFIRVIDTAGNETYQKIASLNVIEPVVMGEIEPIRVAKAESATQLDEEVVVAYDVAPTAYKAPKSSAENSDKDQGEEVAQAGKILSSEDIRDEGVNWTVWLIVFGLVALSSLVAAISYYGYGQVIEAKEKAGSNSSDDITTTVKKVASEETENVKKDEDDLDEYVRW